MTDTKRFTALELALQVFVLPLTLLNAFSGIVGGVWLGFTHNLSIVFLGLFYMFVGTTILGLILLPGFGLAALSVKLYEHRKTVWLGSCLNILGWIYDLIIVTASVVAVFAVLANHFQGGNRIAFLLWGYAVALAPWAYMASRESDNQDSFNATLGLTFALSLGMTSSLVAGFISHNTAWLLAPYCICMGLFMLVMLYMSFWYIPATLRAESPNYLEPIKTKPHKLTQKKDSKIMDGDELVSWDDIKKL